MYYAKLEGNLIVALYNGNFDYVHRLTGEAMKGAVRVPDDCVQVTGGEYDELLQYMYTWNYEWNGTNIVKVVANGLEYKIGLILFEARVKFMSDRREELTAMTEAELDAILAEGN